MAKKLSLEEVKEEFIKRGYIPLFEICNNNKEKLLANTKEGYIIETTLYDLKRGTPSIFGKGNSHTIYNIKQWLQITNSPYKLLSTEYKNAGRDKLIWECPIHGKFEMLWNNMLRGQRCGKCVLFEKPTLEQVKSEFIKRGYIPLFDEYKSNRKSLLAQTKDNYKFIITLTSLKNSENRCIFHKSNPYTIENIKTWLKNNKSPYELISTKYENNCTNLIWNCKIHGNFEMTWNSLSHGSNCPKCVNDNRKGENSPTWKGGITPLHNHLRNVIAQWKQDSFKLYNYKCDITGVHNNLIIHHFHNFSDILRETMMELNLPIYQKINKYTNEELKQIEEKCLELHYKYGLGVCLCEEEHKRFHSMFGYGNNTPEQYYKFKEIRLNKNEDLKVAN